MPLPKFDFTSTAIDSASYYAEANNSKPPINIYNLEEISNRCNSYTKLIRVTAYILRFIDNLKAKINHTNLSTGVISINEFCNAEKIWFNYVQHDVKNNSAYKQLSKDLQFFQQDGIIRCKGRLKNTPLNYDTKFPIFIPRTCNLALIIIRHYHSLVLHSGVKDTINSVRSRFWIPKVRNFIRRFIKSCNVCIKVDRPTMTYPNSPPLPSSRLTDSRPFDFTGVV